MSQTIFVPRSCGGTLILTVGSGVPLPTLQVTALFRDGQVHAQHRDGETKVLHRDGNVKIGGR